MARAFAHWQTYVLRGNPILSHPPNVDHTPQEILEQHGHEVDRTLVERRTYAVGHDAVAYLEQRRSARRTRSWMPSGCERVPCRGSCRWTAELCLSVAWCAPNARQPTPRKS